MGAGLVVAVSGLCLTLLYAGAPGGALFIEGFGEAALGTGDVSKAVSLSAGWIINAVVAECVIRRPVRRQSARRAPSP